MGRLIRGVFTLIGFLVAAYVWFFVPLGQRTLHQHLLRIAATEPAQDLAQEAEVAGRRLAERVHDEWESRYGKDGGVASQ